MGIPHKKITGRRREPRRHTLQNGIDYNMVQYQNISIDVDKSSNIEIGALTLRRLMSYIYGAPIRDVSRSHTTTQHSR